MLKCEAFFTALGFCQLNMFEGTGHSGKCDTVYEQHLIFVIVLSHLEFSSFVILNGSTKLWLGYGYSLWCNKVWSYTDAVVCLWTQVQ